jgi:hypothetical protein
MQMADDDDDDDVDDIIIMRTTRSSIATTSSASTGESRQEGATLNRNTFLIIFVMLHFGNVSKAVV